MLTGIATQQYQWSANVHHAWSTHYPHDNLQRLVLSVIKILRELNLGTLVDRFDAEKIDPYNVISASDSELTRLGVSTIGDRIRLRDLCSWAVERADFEVPSVSTSRYREERLALFNPRRKGRGACGSDSKRRKTAVTKSLTCSIQGVTNRWNRWSMAIDGN